jgi:hypothetical protein
MSDTDIVAIASRVGSSLRRQSERDSEIVQAVIRVLRHPAHQRLADDGGTVNADTSKLSTQSIGEVNRAFLASQTEASSNPCRFGKLYANLICGGGAGCADQCPLLAVKRTSRKPWRMSAFDPKRTLQVSAPSTRITAW